MFLHGHFTLPITIGTTVGAKGIKKRAATTDRAVAQHHDADFTAFKAVQSLRLSCVKPVPNHLVAPLSQMMARSLGEIDGNVFASGCRLGIKVQHYLIDRSMHSSHMLRTGGGLLSKRLI